MCRVCCPQSDVKRLILEEHAHYLGVSTWWQLSTGPDRRRWAFHRTPETKWQLQHRQLVQDASPTLSQRLPTLAQRLASVLYQCWWHQTHTAVTIYATRCQPHHTCAPPYFDSCRQVDLTMTWGFTSNAQHSENQKNGWSVCCNLSFKFVVSQCVHKRCCKYYNRRVQKNEGDIDEMVNLR